PSAFAVGSASVTCGRSAARAKRGSPPITTAAAVVPAATFRKRQRASLFSSCDLGNLRRWGESPSRAATEPTAMLRPPSHARREWLAFGRDNLPQGDKPRVV